VRSAALVLVLVLPGCHVLLGIDDFQTAAPVDGSSDGGDGGPDAPTDAFVIDTPPGSPCFGTLSPVCFATLPTGDLTISGSINTDTDPRCQVRTQPGGPDLCAIAANNLTVSAAVATGSRPLVLVATQNLVVQGALNVSSARNGTIGAAANVVACAGKAGGNGALSGGGGGAGGAMGGIGAAGGNAVLAPGGAMGPAVTITAIRGGCAGGRGGNGDPDSGGPGGSSGGAIALLAGGKITIDATGAVYASGAGGSANNSQGADDGAGGGGGSGGLIVLDAPEVVMNGTVTANGGGGGGGGHLGSGSPGNDGSTSNYTQIATGGAGQGGGSSARGGNGGAGTTAATAGTGTAIGGSGEGGAGGGGGAFGVIWVKGTLTGTRFSPAVQQH